MSAEPHDLANLGELFKQFVDETFNFDDWGEGELEEQVGHAAAASVTAPDEVWDDMQQEMLRHSCAYFASEVLQGPPQAPYNGRFFIADHHMEWDQLIAENDRVCCLAPRDHGKTFFFDFAMPIWKAAFQPSGKGYIFSATQDQAVRILEDIKEEIESNPKLAFLNPTNKRANWSKTQITLANGHKIYARGFGTKIRGAHPNWIVVDDGLNDEDAYSELVRQKHIDYFYTAITNMCIPGGQIVVVGTPFHAADLYGDLSQNKRYCFRKYQALDEDGNALWPERYCATEKQRKELAAQGIVVESLENRKTEIGSVRFTREFLCQPISDEMSLFPEKLFRGKAEALTVKLGMSREYYERLGITDFFVGFDFALSASTSADFTVGFVLGLDSKGNRWVVDIQRHKGLEYGSQLSLINALGRKYQATLIYLEANQMQRIFGDTLIQETDLPIFKFNTSGTKKTKKHPTGNSVTQNKNSLEGGVPSLRVLLENGKVKIPRGCQRSVEVTETWIQEMKCFTWLEGKLQGVGSHDDTVMAFWIADCAVRAGAFSASFGADVDSDNFNLEDFLRQQSEEVEEEELKGDPVAELLLTWQGSEEPEDVVQHKMHEAPTADLGFGDVDDTFTIPQPNKHPDADIWSKLPGL